MVLFIINSFKGMFIDNNKSIVSSSNVNNIKSYSVKEDNSSFLENSEKQFADGEFLKNVQKALQNAINENEEVIIF